MKLSELLSYWVQNYARVHCKKWRAFQREYELYLSPLGDREIESIRRSDIIRLQAQLVETKGKSAANAAVTLLSMLYNKAIDWELYEGKNPASRIRKFKIQPRERFLQPEELPRFLEAVSRLRNTTTRDLFLMLLFTGQRRRNTSSMRWDEIDFNRCTWQIPDTKNGTPHTVPLIEPAMRILQSRKGVHPEWVFPKKNGSGPVWCRYTSWVRVLELAGIENLRMHDLRRSLASWQAITGSSLPIIAKTLNHKDTKSTQIYARLHLDPVRDSMSAAVDELLSHGEGSIVRALIHQDKEAAAISKPRKNAIQSTEADKAILEGKILEAIRAGAVDPDSILSECFSGDAIPDYMLSCLIDSLRQRGLIESFFDARQPLVTKYRLREERARPAPRKRVSAAIRERVKAKVLDCVDSGRQKRTDFWMMTSRETRVSAQEMESILDELIGNGLIEPFQSGTGGHRLGFRRPMQAEVEPAIGALHEATRK